MSDRRLRPAARTAGDDLDAPATGEAMAELILDGATRAVYIGPFDSGRMKPFGRAAIRRVLPGTA